MYQLLAAPNRILGTIESRDQGSENVLVKDQEWEPTTFRPSNPYIPRLCLESY